MIEEQIAWIIDPEAFSDATSTWMEANPKQAGQWHARRAAAKRKARQIIAFMKEERWANA